MAVQYVRIYYGPYESFFTFSHKPQKLRGLRDHLHKLGFRVQLVPVEYVNYCMIEMCGYEVFRCKIKNLSFNTPYEQDPVCRRAIKAIVDSSAKLNRAGTYLWFWALLQDQTFRRNDFNPKDFWITTKEVQNLVKPLECVSCCMSEKESCWAVEDPKTNVT